MHAYLRMSVDCLLSGGEKVYRIDWTEDCVLSVQRIS